MKFSDSNEEEQLEMLCERFAFVINVLDRIDYYLGQVYFSELRNKLARELTENRECSINIQEDMIYITDRKTGDIYVYERQKRSDYN